MNVPLPVVMKLCRPELGIACWKLEVPAALVGVPEATLNEDGSPVLVDDNVGSAWQTRDVQAEPDTQSEKSSADNQFGLGIFAPDSAHHPRADLWLYDVSHG